MENDTKQWYHSKGIVGSLVTILVMIIGLFGYNIGMEDQTQIVNFILELGGIVGAVVAIIGRIKASKKIGFKNE